MKSILNYIMVALIVVSFVSCDKPDYPEPNLGETTSTKVTSTFVNTSVGSNSIEIFANNAKMGDAPFGEIVNIELPDAKTYLTLKGEKFFESNKPSTSVSNPKKYTFLAINDVDYIKVETKDGKTTKDTIGVALYKLENDLTKHEAGKAHVRFLNYAQSEGSVQIAKGGTNLLPEFIEVDNKKKDGKVQIPFRGRKYKQDMASVTIVKDKYSTSTEDFVAIDPTSGAYAISSSTPVTANLDIQAGDIVTILLIGKGSSLAAKVIKHN